MEGGEAAARMMSVRVSALGGKIHEHHISLTGGVAKLCVRVLKP